MPTDSVRAHLLQFHAPRAIPILDVSALSIKSASSDHHSPRDVRLGRLLMPACICIGFEYSTNLRPMPVDLGVAPHGEPQDQLLPRRKSHED